MKVGICEMKIKGSMYISYFFKLKSSFALKDKVGSKANPCFKASKRNQ